MESKPATELSLTQLAEVFTLSFTNYFGRDISFSSESLGKFCKDNFICLPRSHVLFSLENEPVAFGLIAIRPDKPAHSRLAAMGVVPSFRGKGAGSRVVTTVIEAERERGVLYIELEAIQDNTPAVNLYKRLGFIVVRALAGWERDPPLVGELVINSDVQECEIAEVDALVKTHATEDMPWQAWGFSNVSDGGRAFRLDHAYCVISNPDNEDLDTVSMQSLVVEPDWRGQGQARSLIEAIMAKFPGKKWQARPIFPREFGASIAKALGFSEMKNSQHQMRLML